MWKDVWRGLRGLDPRHKRGRKRHAALLAIFLLTFITAWSIRSAAPEHPGSEDGDVADGLGRASTGGDPSPVGDAVDGGPAAEPGPDVGTSESSEGSETRPRGGSGGGSGAGDGDLGEAPTADFVLDCIDLYCALDGQVSRGQVVNWTWTVDDAAMFGAYVNHTFAEPGQYPIVLVVTDDDGLTGRTERLATVTDEGFCLGDGALPCDVTGTDSVGGLPPVPLGDPPDSTDGLA